MPSSPRYGDFVGRAAKLRVGAPSATTTTLKALPAEHESRMDGAITVVLADSSLWIFDADATLGAQDGILVPASGTGRWKLLGVAGSGGAGVDYKGSVRCATTGALAAYTRTANTILADANGALGAIDGVTLSVGQRLLLKNGAAGADNGIWVVDAAGAGGSKYQLSRAEDFDASADVTAGALVYVSEGTANGNAWFMLTTDDAITLNTTALTFAKLPTLADLASTSTGLGASLLGLEDAGALYVAENAEAALAEVKAIADAAIGAVKRTVTVGHGDLTELVNGTAMAFNIGAVCPANSRVLTVSAYGTELTGGGVVSVALDVGTAGDPNAIVAAADVLAAFVDGEASTLPAGIAPNKKIGAAQLIATFTPDGGHALNDLTAGSVTIDVLVVPLA